MIVCIHLAFKDTFLVDEIIEIVLPLVAIFTESEVAVDVGLEAINSEGLVVIDEVILAKVVAYTLIVC